MISPHQKKAWYVSMIWFMVAFLYPLTHYGQKDERRYEHLMKNMSIDQKIGQMMMVAAYSNKGPAHVASIEKLIKDHHIGGLIFFQGDPLHQAYLTNYYQELSETPLLIGMDAEWGLSMRLSPAMKFPFQLTLGSLSNDDLIYQTGYLIGKQCRAMGIHINFAPVADVNNNPSNPIINFRSFGENPHDVAHKSLKFALGMQEAGVMACAKHFPGHGDTDADSHKELPSIGHNRAHLDSVELYPFRYLAENGIASMMLAHLHVPALDKRPGRPTSLSRDVVTHLLKDSFGFKGLTITDALNMKGVRNTFPAGKGELEAFIAGNHILLFPDNIPLAVSKIKQALSDGTISYQELDQRVLDILRWKEWGHMQQALQLEKNTGGKWPPSFEGHFDAPLPIHLETLHSELFNEEVDSLIQRIARESIIVADDQHQMIPLSSTSAVRRMFFVLGAEPPTSWMNAISFYFPEAAVTFIKRGSDWEAYQAYIRQAQKGTQYIVSIHQPKIWNTKNQGFSDHEIRFIRELNGVATTANLFFCNPYILNKFTGLKTVIAAHEDDYWFHLAAADILSGRVGAMGNMPVSAGGYPAGTGIRSEKGQVKGSSVMELKTGKLSAAKRQQLDQITDELIQKKAAPGCRILVLKHGEILYDKSAGKHTYDKDGEPVKPEDLYDLASVTKVAATTLAVMKLFEKGLLSLDDPLGKYLVWTRKTNKENITIREILLHESGLPAWLPFYRETLGAHYDQMYRSQQDSNYCVPVAHQLYLHDDQRFEIYRKIIETPLGPKKYLYSDLGMILMREVVEQASGEPFDWFLNQEIYDPMGLENIRFNPLCCFEKHRLVPTEQDVLYRNQLIHGYVHDPCAAMLGGYSGHAGLFSNAYDLAALGQMLMNGGTYNGISIFKPETIRLFTSKQSAKSRRGLGWDRPEKGGGASPSSKLVSDNTFGHTGFTGTALWIDPVHQIVFVFLSNRVYPNENNRELIQGNYRTRLQDIFYQGP